MNVNCTEYIDRYYDNLFDSADGVELSNHITLNGKKVFLVSHDALVHGWTDSDYELKMIQEGICSTCCAIAQSIHSPNEVVVQSGSFRFGVNVGICLPCIYSAVKIKQLKNLKFDLFFKESKDIHNISITPDKLQELSLQFSPKNEINGMLMQSILKNLGSLIDQANKEKEKNLLCKKCKKIVCPDQDYDFFLEQLNIMRSIKKIAGMCLGCGMGIILSDGCSMATCKHCVSGTKTCIACMEGASGITHNLKDCTTKMSDILQNPSESAPLPDLLKCDCADVDVNLTS